MPGEEIGKQEHVSVCVMCYVCGMCVMCYVLCVMCYVLCVLCVMCAMCVLGVCAMYELSPEGYAYDQWTYVVTDVYMCIKLSPEGERYMAKC